MVEKTSFDPQSFKGMEHVGWERAAKFYSDYAGKITSQATEVLLDAASVGARTRVLEVCCGPGYGADAAVARGAIAVGLDFARPMVELARQNVPEAEFLEGDAEALPFEASSFDAVICPFGLLHLAEPERAVAEAYRVLVPGGRYAFTVWCSLDKVEFFELVFGAIQTHGTLDVPLPEAPPMFRFSDHEECRSVLSAAGFVAPEITEIPLFYYPDTADQLLDLTYKSAVRTPMVLKLQTDEARRKIHETIIEGAKRFEKDGRIELAMPAVLVTARKP